MLLLEFPLVHDIVYPLMFSGFEFNIGGLLQLLSESVPHDYALLETHDDVKVSS